MFLVVSGRPILVLTRDGMAFKIHMNQCGRFCQPHSISLGWQGFFNPHTLNVSPAFPDIGLAGVAGLSGPHARPCHEQAIRGRD